VYCPILVEWISPAVVSSQSSSGHCLKSMSCQEFVAIITNPFRNEMRSFDFDENKISFGNIPDLSKCFLLLKALLELLKLPSLNSTQQNRVMTLSKHFFKILPPRVPVDHPMDITQCRFYWRQVELLRGAETLQNAATCTMSNITSVRCRLTGRFRVSNSNTWIFQEIKNIFRFVELPPSFSLHSLWSYQPLTAPIPGRRFLYVPPFSCVASDLLTGIQPMNGWDDQPVIHLLTQFRQCLPIMKPVPLWGSTVRIVYIVEAVLERVSPRSVTCHLSPLIRSTASRAGREFWTAFRFSPTQPTTR
jgi:hypothetical protein